jgi:hypothetical protein
VRKEERINNYFSKTKGEKKKKILKTLIQVISHSMSKIGGGGVHHAGTQYADCLPISQPQY